MGGCGFLWWRRPRWPGGVRWKWRQSTRPTRQLGGRSKERKTDRNRRWFSTFSNNIDDFCKFETWRRVNWGWMKRRHQRQILIVYFQDICFFFLANNVGPRYDRFDLIDKQGNFGQKLKRTLRWERRQIEFLKKEKQNSPQDTSYHDSQKIALFSKIRGMQGLA